MARNEIGNGDGIIDGVAEGFRSALGSAMMISKDSNLKASASSKETMRAQS